MMEVRKAARIIIVLYVNNLWEIEGQELFFADFIQCFNNENPVFIGTDDFDLEFHDKEKKYLTGLIRYSTNKDEEQLGQHLKNLQLLGDLTMVVFVDNGHHQLLDILINDLQLFKEGLTGLVPEQDVAQGLNLTLQLDTGLYTYMTKFNTTSLKEIYAINGEIKVTTIGIWRKKTGLVIPTKSMWERRSNLEGMSIRVAIVHEPPLQELHYDKTGKSIIGGSGLFLEPLNILAKKLNFTLALMPSKDGQYGAMDSNGTWNGLINMIINKETDIALILGVTEARQKVGSLQMKK